MRGRKRLTLAAEAALDRKAGDLVALDMRGLTLVADYFVLCNGRNALHVKAIVDRILERLKETGAKPDHVEGYESARWVLLDFGDVVIHVFQEEARSYYNLERLWGDAEPVEMTQVLQA